MGKVINKKDLEEIIKSINEEKKTIVLTNGCFDILHIGHARYLNAAKKLGDYLFVGINSDNSVKKLKGNDRKLNLYFKTNSFIDNSEKNIKDDDRPINNENDRAELLSYFYCVDYLIIFEEQTADNLIIQVKPDIYAKGGDYTLESLPEAKTLVKIGAKAAFISFVEGYSTTKLIEKVNLK